MYKIGEMRRPKELGLGGWNKRYFYPCEGCGKPRWKVKEQLYQRLCKKCSMRRWVKKHRGENSRAWKGGKRTDSQGYTLIKLLPDDFFYPTAMKDAYIFEHRLVMAKHLGRNLHRWEIVHHKHTKYPAGSIEDKQDNRIENLQLVSDDRHKQITILETRIARLEKRIIVLEAENVLLNEQLVRIPQK